ncbi:MAG: tRNA threonylcarbamoyladenosine dehydratase [Candidatus Omnitrophica bacterium]|nr:tRNA threonylcarbamoyladenosine dehydratase [Candidatus Omnitrophota bacterium]
MLHAFSRTELLIGKEALKKLNQSKVAIFGVGGVGSFTVEALARSGIGKFLLVDNDKVCITNINRQLPATVKSIGKLKVELMKNRIFDINPEAEVETLSIFYLPEHREIITKDIDYIVDAVDTVTAKIDIVCRANELGIPVISCMGAGNKLDPTKFMVEDLFSTSVCPLCKVMRKELNTRGIKSLKVVYSKETPIKISGSTEVKGSTKRSVPGSIAFVPSVAGLIAAGEVIKDLIKNS